MKVFALIATLFLATPTFAQNELPAIGQDLRLREIAYKANDIVQLDIAPSRQLTILFGSGEKIVSVAVGDSESWQVTASRTGDSLFIKPAGTSSETNMTVITDARVYLFELMPGSAADSMYLLRFTYPEQAEPERERKPEISEPGVYHLRGAKALFPSAISDDGSKTYMTWAEGRAMPAIFGINSSGEEMLVDGYIRDGAYTLDRVYSRIVFRVDKQKATATRK